MQNQSTTQNNLSLARGDVFRIGQNIAVAVGDYFSLNSPNKEGELDFMLLSGENRGHYKKPLRDVARVQDRITKISNFDTDPGCKPYLTQITRIRSGLGKFFHISHTLNC